jgi:predicted RNA-binding protein YlqC (UPF0109 family)
MRNLLEYILVHIVLHPDDVRIDESENEGRFEFVIHVHPEDVGRVIGRSGRTIEAIRSIAKVRAMKDNIMVNVKVASDDNEPSEAPAQEAAPQE